VGLKKVWIFLLKDVGCDTAYIWCNE